ncbi:MAG: hypothetical protein RLZZ67_456 [Candidatus Parcubacteria bacterium]|jgi:Tol biopolymer transport system component
MKKVFIILLSLFTVFVLGLFSIRPILSNIYTTPQYSKILSEFRVRSLDFSPNSPQAVFTYEIKKNYKDSEYGLGTGLVDLENEKVTVLSEKNSMPNNSSMFSPDGKNLLYAVARDVDTEMFTNENGIWRTVYGFDLYVKDLSTGNSVRISKEDNPMWVPKQSSGVFFFGWRDTDEVFYTCTTNKQKNGSIEDYCFTNIVTNQTERKGRELPQIYIDKTNTVSLNHGGGYNFDKTKQIYTKCVLSGYDGCSIMITRLKNQNEDLFLANRSSAVTGNFLWSYNDHIYVLPMLWGTDQTVSGIYKVY